jgi:hypothetical protein
MVFWQG